MAKHEAGRRAGPSMEGGDGGPEVAERGEALVIRADVVARSDGGSVPGTVEEGAPGLEPEPEGDVREVAFTVDPRLTQAAALTAVGRDADAIRIYREMIEEDADALPPRLGLSRLYQNRGEHILAVEQLEAARGAAPDEVEVMLGLAASLAAQRSYELAERELRRAQRLVPDRWDVHQQLGILSFKRGLYADADLELRKSIELEPGQAASYFYRGETLNLLGRIDEALEMLERAVQLDPRNARAYYAMGILYDRKHLSVEAAAMYRKARDTGAA